MDNSLHKGMDALLNGQAQKDMSAYKGTYDEREHRPQQSAFEQFEQEYPQLSSGRSWMNAGVNTILGGSTPSPEMMRGEVDLRQGEPGLEDAFMGMDTLTGYAVPRVAAAYGNQILKNAPEIAEKATRALTGDLVGMSPELGITKKLTPSESKYFDMIIGSPADKAELYEMVPSFRVKKGVASVSQADSGKLADYIDETYSLNEGVRLPPSFYKGDFAKRFGFDEARIPDFNASKTPTFDELMSQEIPAMLQRQSGLQVDPNFKPKTSMLDDDIFTLDNRHRNR